MNNVSILDRAMSTLDNFGYPDELREIILRFTLLVQNYLPDQEPGILLVGSAARGELSWSRQSGRLSLFSDIEFLVAMADKKRTDLSSLKEEILELENDHNLGDMFHIDYTFIDWERLGKLETKFFIFESKSCGIDLGVRSISGQLPVVDLNNLNWHELNEVLLHRLSSMLHAIPASLLDSTIVEEEQQSLVLNIAKNTLDLTTWLHPYEATKLEVGFRRRLACWDQAFLKTSELGKYFSISDIDYINSCLELRTSPYKQMDVALMLSKTMQLYSKGIIYCKHMNSIDKDASFSNMKISIKLFDEYRLRQRISMAISVLTNLTKFGVIRSLRNITLARKGCAVSICHDMLLSAISYIGGNNINITYLNHAASVLDRLMPCDLKMDSNYLESWIAMRDCFKEYQRVTHIY